MRSLLTVLALAACGRQNFNEGDAGTNRPDGQVGGVNNVAFVTSGLYAPSSFGADLAGADAICQQVAMSAGLPDASYIALLATSSKSVIGRLQGSRGWVRTDGEPLLDRPDDISGLGWLHPLAADENGELVNSGAVITGSSADGTGIDANCSDFTDFSGTYEFGSTRREAQGLLATGAQSCDSDAHLYCVGLGKTAKLEYTRAVGRLAFVSETARNGSFGGAPGADVICQQEATGIGATGTFKALLTESGNSSGNRIQRDGEPWVRIDGVLLADSALDFLAGRLKAALTVTSTGDYIANVAWTGGEPLALSPGNCADWGSNSATNSATYGLTEAVDRPAFNVGQSLCNQSARFYCLQQ